MAMDTGLSKEKLATLEQLFGKARARKIIEEALKRSKQAEALGIAYKDMGGNKVKATKTREQCVKLFKLYNPAPTREHVRAFEKMLADYGTDRAYEVIAGAGIGRKELSAKEQAQVMAIGVKRGLGLYGNKGRAKVARKELDDETLGILTQLADKLEMKLDTIIELLNGGEASPADDAGEASKSRRGGVLAGLYKTGATR